VENTLYVHCPCYFHLASLPNVLFLFLVYKGQNARVNVNQSKLKKERKMEERGDERKSFINFM
jgi:hypothetical protein